MIHSIILFIVGLVLFVFILIDSHVTANDAIELFSKALLPILFIVALVTFCLGYVSVFERLTNMVIDSIEIIH
ncbi:hypothetical protein VXS06_14580 [Photobacterium toruni]|uniref:Uncharacterized protein n=1 Tax=Photobacterium toruni TaxID=1935446 RepID=A0ABU6L9Z7_9GAMM|nr:hypothetical protein [Photobacterium toruni]